MNDFALEMDIDKESSSYLHLLMNIIKFINFFAKSLFYIKKNLFTFNMSTRKILVLYVFHVFDKRVKYFLRNNVFMDDNIKFLLILNNNTDDFKKSELKLIPKYAILLRRDNIGWDFGGWSEGLLKDNYYQNFDYYLFLNHSCIGPFIKKDEKRNYVDIYVDKLNENTKLVGSTINTMNNPLEMSHVQSYIFATDKEALNYLISKKIFTMEIDKNLSASMFRAIARTKEIKLSRCLIDNGWNICCLHKYFDNYDFTIQNLKKSNKDLEYGSKLNDIMFKKYDNVLWTKDELVFVKGNRLKIDKV